MSRFRDSALLAVLTGLVGTGACTWESAAQSADAVLVETRARTAVRIIDPPRFRVAPGQDIGLVRSTAGDRVVPDTWWLAAERGLARTFSQNPAAEYWLEVEWPSRIGEATHWHPSVQELFAVPRIPPVVVLPIRVRDRNARTVASFALELRPAAHRMIFTAPNPPYMQAWLVQRGFERVARTLQGR